ncbi:MAG TPA: hypothetical protein DCE41_32705 [Cytophagales bacterium]|nr:hypothetical protein [Cytophagales bacterium]HAA22905.1 hypothetical protein [Cytophagales bacterium]HAP60573.1 hypothetical protein [Cytophagales bacterium]
MQYATFSEITDNIVKVSFAGFDPNEQQFEAYLKEFEVLITSRRGIVVILDGSKAKYLSSKLRIRQGNWIKENRESIRESCEKWCYVINSPLVKFIMQGIFLVQKPPVDYAVFTSIPEAEADAKNRLLVKLSA